MGTDGQIQSPPEGCVAGEAKTVCQYPCPGNMSGLSQTLSQLRNLFRFNSWDISAAVPPSEVILLRGQLGQLGQQPHPSQHSAQEAILRRSEQQ